MKTLITSKYTDEELESLRDLGYKIVFKAEKDISMSDDIRDVDVMVCSNPFEKIDIEEFTNLRWIQLLTAGVNQVPIHKVLAKNIVLTNNRGGYSIPIAEWIVLKILEMIKNTREFYHKQDDKIWKKTPLF